MRPVEIRSPFCFFSEIKLSLICCNYGLAPGVGYRLQGCSGGLNVGYGDYYFEAGCGPFVEAVTSAPPAPVTCGSNTIELLCDGLAPGVTMLSSFERDTKFKENNISQSRNDFFFFETNQKYSPWGHLTHIIV